MHALFNLKSQMTLAALVGRMQAEKGVDFNSMALAMDGGELILGARDYLPKQYGDYRQLELDLNDPLYFEEQFLPRRFEHLLQIIRDHFRGLNFHEVAVTPDIGTLIVEQVPPTHPHQPMGHFYFG